MKQDNLRSEGSELGWSLLSSTLLPPLLHLPLQYGDWVQREGAQQSLFSKPPGFFLAVATKEWSPCPRIRQIPSSARGEFSSLLICQKQKQQPQPPAT